MRVRMIGNSFRTGGKLLLRLNINGIPIANKYREGTLKSTLERE